MIGTRLYHALVVGHPADRRTHEELAPMIRLPLAALASVVLAVLGVVFLLPQCAFACQCTMPPGSQGTERALADSEAVFSGEVVKIDPPSPWKSSAIIETDTFRVFEVWKGPEQRTLEVHTALMGISCGYPFKEGKSTWSTPTAGSEALRSICATGPSGSPRRKRTSKCWELAGSRRGARSSPTPRGAFRGGRWPGWRGWRWRRRCR